MSMKSADNLDWAVENKTKALCVCLSACFIVLMSEKMHPQEYKYLTVLRKTFFTNFIN